MTLRGSSPHLFLARGTPTYGLVARRRLVSWSWLLAALLVDPGKPAALSIWYRAAIPASEKLPLTEKTIGYNANVALGVAPVVGGRGSGQRTSA